MRQLRICSLVCITAVFALGCTEKESSTRWTNEFDVLFSGERFLGQSGSVQGYLTEDGRLWLYKEDANIQRLEHAMQLEGLPEDVVKACSKQFVTIYGKLVQARPVVIEDIQKVTPLNADSACVWEI